MLQVDTYSQARWLFRRQMGLLTLREVPMTLPSGQTTSMRKKGPPEESSSERMVAFQLRKTRDQTPVSSSSIEILEPEVIQAMLRTQGLDIFALRAVEDTHVPQRAKAVPSCASEGTNRPSFVRSATFPCR